MHEYRAFTQRTATLAEVPGVDEWVHLTASARGGWRPGEDAVVARELWRALDRAFPHGHLGVVRDRLVMIADEVGGTNAKDLGDYLHVNESTIRRIRARPRPDISAARMCLADPRLRPPRTRPL